MSTENEVNTVDILKHLHSDLTKTKTMLLGIATVNYALFHRLNAHIDSMVLQTEQVKGVRPVKKNPKSSDVAASNSTSKKTPSVICGHCGQHNYATIAIDYDGNEVQEYDSYCAACCMALGGDRTKWVDGSISEKGGDTSDKESPPKATKETKTPATKKGGTGAGTSAKAIAAARKAGTKK